MTLRCIYPVCGNEVRRRSSSREFVIRGLIRRFVSTSEAKVVSIAMVETWCPPVGLGPGTAWRWLAVVAVSSSPPES